MARRQSKKLLFGLGSTLGTAAITTMGGFGMNGLLRINNQSMTAVDQLNTIQTQNIQNFPNLHVATAPMFINTTNLKSFHYGNVRRGQTITPYGWLGVYDDEPNPSGFTRYRLALTAWNGEILWVYNGYETNTDPGSGARNLNGNIYDVKYDFNTDLITVIYSDTFTGLFNPEDTRGHTYIDVIDAKTGQQLPGWKPRDVGFYWGSNAKLAFSDRTIKLLTNMTNNPDVNESWRAVDLYKLDLTSRPGNDKQMVIQYTPTFNQLYAYGTNTYPTFQSVLQLYPHVSKISLVDRNRSDWWESDALDIQAWLSSKWLSGNQLSFIDSVLNQGMSLRTDQTYLLADPYISPAAQDSEWFLHIFLGDQAGETYHLALNFTYSPQVLNPRFNSDKSKFERISTGLNFNVSVNQYKWYENTQYFNRAMIITNPANLRVNKNMFNPNLATWAYPYASVAGNNIVDNGGANTGKGTGWALYNVAQILIDPSTGLIQRNDGPRQTRNYDLGKQILDNWKTNPNTKIQPWPDLTKNIHRSAQHNFNRLVSVSPFDNSFVYSSMANFTQGHYTDGNENFKSWWLFNANYDKNNANPFIISGDNQNFASGLNSKMLNMADLELNGLTWDLESAINSRTNLYLNHSGTTANTSHGSPTGWSTSKIIPIGPIETNVTISSFLGSFGNTTGKTTVISEATPAGLIHSRANLTKWYNRTQASIENPTNMLANDALVNKGSLGGKVQANFKTSISIPSGGDAKDLVDIVTHAGNTSSLSITNPEIRINDGGGSTTVKMRVKFSPRTTTLNWYQTTFSSFIDNINHLVYTQDHNIENTSVEVFSKVGKHVKFTSLRERIGIQTAATNSTRAEVVVKPTWFDVRQNSSVTQPFDSINNALEDGGRLPLRVLVQLVKPTNAPTWMNNFNSMVWQPVPIEADRLPSESGLQDVLWQYMKDLLKYIRNDDLTQWGIGNLKIRATLGINPMFANESRIFALGRKQVILGKNGSVYVFEDRHDVEDTLIYDQSATSYEQMQEQGYGTAVQSKIAKNWKTTPSGKFLVDIPLNDLRGVAGLANPIIRRGVSFGDNTPLFRVKLKPNQLILMPTDQTQQEINWLRNLLSTLNFKYGMFAIFEGWTGNDWVNIKSDNSTYSDHEIQQAWNTAENIFVFGTNKNNITKFRIRLTYRAWDKQTNNDFVVWEPQPIHSQDRKLLSAEHPISAIDVLIDKSWFEKTILTSANFLQTMTESDLVSYQMAIKDMFTASNSVNDLWDKLDWEWIFDNHIYNTNQDLIGAMQSKLNAHSDPGWNRGFWTLWSGDSSDVSGKKIIARLKVKSNYQTTIQLVDPNGNLINSESQRQGVVKANIKTQMDIKPYLDALQGTGLNAVPASSVGVLQSLSIPNVSVAAPWNIAYSEIASMLANLGVELQFKGQNPNGQWEVQWVSDLKQIHKYYPQNPKIRIRAVIVNNKINGSLYFGATEVDPTRDFGENGIEIAINVPKLVVGTNNFGDFINQQVNGLKPFAGNTWKLSIDNVQSFEEVITNNLIKASDPSSLGTHANLSRYVRYQYQLGSSQFWSAAQLQSHLASLTTDQNANDIRMRIILDQSQGLQEFVLDSSLNQIFEILPNDNVQVKKWIHGYEQEAALHQITVSGDRTNIVYNFPPILSNYENTAVNNVSLQWSWIDPKTNQAPTHQSGTWVNNQESNFPTSLTGNNATNTKIYVRLKHDDKDSIYQYGPEAQVATNPGGWTIGVVDLSQINFLLKVDRDWFTAEAITSAEVDLNALQESQLENWKTRIWNRSNFNEDLRTLVDIEFQIFDNKWIASAELIAKLQAAQRDYGANHNGIISMWDGTSNDSSMTKIRARFVKKSSLITFVNQSNTPIVNDQQLTGDVNSAKIITTIDLSNYFDVVQVTPTVITSDLSNPGSIKKMVLPFNTSGQHLLSNRSFEQIMQILNNHKINFLFASNVNDVNKDWKSYKDVTTYDPNIGKLNIALANHSSNLKVVWKSGVLPIEPGTDNKNANVLIPLQAPKVLTITTGDYVNLVQAFTGDTKHLHVDNQILLARLDEIKQRHVAASQNSDFKSAPLKLGVKIGNEPFADYTQIESILSAKSTDLDNRAIAIEFSVESSQINGQPEWIIGGVTQQEIASDATSKLLIYINDQGIEQELKTTTFKGTSQQFSWNWPSGYVVDPKTGVLNHASKGKGLKLEFTFAAQLNPTIPTTGTDPFNSWVTQVPTSFDVNLVPSNQVFIRFGVIDSGKYIAQKQPQNANDKISLVLNLKEILEVNASWLDAQIVSQPKWITNLTLADLTAYENSVLNNMSGWTDANKKRVAINYTFNQQTYTAGQLISAIATARDKVEHLQLWNGVVGSKIEATFVKTNPGGNYELAWNAPGSTKQVIDTSKISTRIDLEAVIVWLKQSKIAFMPGTSPNTISQITIGNVTAAGSKFDGQNWNQIVSILANLQVKVQYQEMVNNQQTADPNNWVDDLNLIKQFDKRGQFLIRFILEANTAENIYVKLFNDQIQGTTAAQLVSQPAKMYSEAIVLNLQTPLTIELNENSINNFINYADVIGGNTHDLVINESAESGLIADILAQNHSSNPNANPHYLKAPLKIEYAIGLAPTQNDWYTRDQFIQKLSLQTTDQNSNQIQFRFVVVDQDPNHPDFNVTDKPYVLNQHSPINQSTATTKIKYFIHKANWELNANRIAISGSNNAIQWDFTTAFGQAVSDLKQVTLQTAGANPLVLQFTTNRNATYADPTGGDLTTGWVYDKPKQIDPNTQHLKVRIVPINESIYYEAKELGQATVHDIDVSKLKREIEIEKKWLIQNLVVAAPSKEISALTASDIDNYEKAVMDNFINPALKPHVVIKYSIGSFSNLDKANLLTVIQSKLTNPATDDMGIVHLWNETSGLQIKANFDLSSVNSSYVLIDKSTGQVISPQATAQIVTTKSIITLINFTKYIKQLKSVKLDVTLGASPNTLTKINWPVHNGAANDQFGTKTLEQILAVFAKMGITMQVRFISADPNASISNWVAWNQLVNYDSGTNKIEIRFVLDQSKGRNVRVMLDENQSQLDGTNNKLESSPVELQLNAPLKFTINQQWINDFKAKNPLSGNTKYLKINEVLEKELIDKIFQFNIANNADFAQARDQFHILYALGPADPGANWLKRDQIISLLSQSTTDQRTNQFSMKFVIDNIPNATLKFQVDEHLTNVVDAAIGQKDARVKIYINEANRENLAEQIYISGTNNNFKWTYPPGLSPAADGTFRDVPGLQMQWSLKTDINNQPFSTSNSDPTKGWVNQAPLTIDSNNRFIAIQLVARDGYEYGPQYKEIDPSDSSNHWRVHRVNVDNIKSEIIVDLNVLNQIVWTGSTHALDFKSIQQLQNRAIQSAVADPQLQAKLKIQYQVTWGTHVLVSWKEDTQAILELQNWATTTTGPTSGLIKFNGWGSTQFATVKARFVANDSNFVVVDQNQMSSEHGIVVDASQVMTKIDLNHYTSILTTQFVKLKPNSNQNNLGIDTLPSMDANDPSGFMANYTWDQIRKVLSLIGLEAQFRASDITNDWTTLDKITALNQNNQLEMRWIVNSKLISANQSNLQAFARTFNLITTTTQDLTTGEHASSSIDLKVNLPIVITTDSNQLPSRLTTQFSGNTYQLQINQSVTIVEEIILSTITTNQTPGHPPLKIKFSLDHQPLQGGQIWFEIRDFVAALQSSQTNWQTNQILAKFVIDNPQGASQEYEITDGNEIVVVAKDDSSNAQVKKWIHAGSFWDEIVNNLKPSGTTYAYQFPTYNVWSKSLPLGLTLELNNVSDAFQDGNWISFDLNNLPKPLNPNKQLWVRLRVNDSFVFASASTNNDRYTETKQLDASNIKAVLDVQKSWLNLITTSGSLKNLQIDDSKFKDVIDQSNILPTGNSDLLQAQFRVKGSKWLNKQEFEKHLQTLNGSKDANRWILVHEDLEVRFAINTNVPQASEYLLAIDGSIIDVDDVSNCASLITNPNRVQGIINTNSFISFTKENFRITGTNAAPKFIVNNLASLNNFIGQYASESLFDIQFSTEFDKNNNQWIWHPNQTLIDASGARLIGEDGLIQQGIQISTDRKFAIRIVNKALNYQVERDNQIQPDGYIINLTDNVNITYEIENPFFREGKTLAITNRNSKNEIIWNQGQGQFRIIVGDNYQPEHLQMSAQEFLIKKLPDNESKHLEFIYRIFDHQPSTDEINLAADKSSINDYATTGVNGWNSFNFTSGNQNQYWSQNLSLKVGYYVMVALRVKEDSAFGDKAYRLKDDQFSVLIPVLPNGQTPGRIAGLKVDPTKANVVTDNVILRSQSPDFTGFLDGWTELERIGLNVDPDDNVAGIDLELNFYNDFHLDTNERVLISASQSKLVKRKQTGMTKGEPYVDLDGKQITDKDGNLVYLWTDPNSKRLAPPLESATPTRTVVLNSQANGWFSVPDFVGDPNLFSLFRNQKISITYKAKVGFGTETQPDYELTQALSTDLRNIISPQIKFAIENPQNIVYDWQNREDFGDDKVEFEPVNGESKPIEGASRVKTVVQLQRRRRTNASDVTTITGVNGADAAKNIVETLRDDFGDQLQFSYTHVKKTGGQNVYDTANFYDLTNLHNGDRIIVELKATADDQIYTDAPEPLAILVSGLAVDAPDASLLQWLRVEQGGTTNGAGSFRVLVHNPSGAYQDPKDYLRGWKFLVRVWDGAKHEVKIDWTDEQAMLTGLSNGDRVEWKLVDQDNNPVQDAYYNTVALRHEVTNPDGTVKFNFGQVDYSDGPNSQRVIQAGIGDYPPKDQADHFPSTSGFTIAGLQEQNLRFDLQPWAFAKIIETLGPFYRGQNGNGALNFNHQYFEGLWYVNLAGELYQTPRYPEPDLQTPQEIPLSQFLNHTTFFTQDPTLNPAQVGFKFMTNATNTGNYLSNGDQVWARFNSVVGLPDASLEPTHHLQSRSGDPEIAYVYQLPDVSGLDQISDPMHPLWWLLIVLAGLVTVGGAWIVVWRKRHHKLRVKNPSA